MTIPMEGRLACWVEMTLRLKTLVSIVATQPSASEIPGNLQWHAHSRGIPDQPHRFRQRGSFCAVHRVRVDARTPMTHTLYDQFGTEIQPAGGGFADIYTVTIPAGSDSVGDRTSPDWTGTTAGTTAMVSGSPIGPAVICSAILSLRGDADYYLSTIRTATTQLCIPSRTA